MREENKRIDNRNYERVKCVGIEFKKKFEIMRFRLWKKEKIEFKVNSGEIIFRERMVNSLFFSIEEKDVEGNIIIILLFFFLFVV